MILFVLLSCLFFLSIVSITMMSFVESKHDTGNNKKCFLPKSRTEMIKGMAAVAIVISHIASYSKGAASSGLLRYYNLFCTSLGGIGVNLFFFISGYGNYFSVLQHKEHRIKWLWKRCRTLLIMYVLCFFAVLGVLFVGGYRNNAQGLLSEFIHLSIPFSSVWYVKIQLLAYGFLVIASLFEQRQYKAITVTMLCLISSIIMFSFGLDEKWWKSTLCFAVGVSAGAYKTEIDRFFLHHKKVVLTLCTLLLPVAYIGAVLIDAYLVKTMGNVVLCIIMMALVQQLQMENGSFCKLGSYSLPLYLVHRSFVAWILADGETTALRVMMIVIISAVLTVLVKKINDLIINNSMIKSF